MNLLFSLILASILFSKGHPLQCYNCHYDDVKGLCSRTTKCETGSLCAKSTEAVYVGGNRDPERSQYGCKKPQECVSYSLNFGHMRMVQRTDCCKTDYCNTGIPAEIKNSLNGMKCFSSHPESYDGILSCREDEVYCFTRTILVQATSQERTKAIKGCASKYVCDHGVQSPEYTGFGIIVNCCQGNLCNDAQRLVQGALIFLVPLLSIILIQ